MDKTALVQEVAELFRLNGHIVETSVNINNREIDIVAQEQQGLIQKKILIECADYATPVGVDKLQTDIRKLQAAKEFLRETAIITHIARNGYTQDASGYALTSGVTALSLSNLVANLINFNNYVKIVENDRQRPVILKEYQPTTIGNEGRNSPSEWLPALAYIEDWRKKESNYLILLGDYGVGKSWLLKRYLYLILDKYKEDPGNNPLPFLVPLQKFTKAFDFQNLILKTFEIYGLSGAYYSAFLHLTRQGRIVLLLDSFDEMAQHLSRTTIRENLTALFDVASSKSKIIMTSRPNYFENRAERILLVDRFDHDSANVIDRRLVESQGEISNMLAERLDHVRFGRLNDLTPDQRAHLFKIVLGDKPSALSTLTNLLKQFQALSHLSQRAVIARLLTTVAETLASPEMAQTLDGVPLIPNDLDVLNQAKIFEIILHNLLQRDQGIGSISARDRLDFLKGLAVFLQRRGGDFFATPDELRNIVKDIFSSQLSRTDTPEQDLENYYRACRRHSGLTTEGQFYDTSGIIDLPVSEHDIDSRVGFSHNSLREYLVSSHVIDAVMSGTDEKWKSIFKISMSDLTHDFIIDNAAYIQSIPEKISNSYLEFKDSRRTDFLFSIIWNFINKDRKKFFSLLGNPPILRGVDMSILNLNGENISNGEVCHCILQDTDLTNSNLYGANFSGSIIERVKFDDAVVKSADFSNATVYSIYAFDEFDTRTSSILVGRHAEQWLYSRGAIVSNPGALNSLMGKPWYEAAREVTRTLEKRIKGTHQEVALAKGTITKYRDFAIEFVDYLIGEGLLIKVKKSNRNDGWVVKLDSDYTSDITNFSKNGIIGKSLKKFFEKRRDINI